MVNPIVYFLRTVSLEQTPEFMSRFANTIQIQAAFHEPGLWNDVQVRFQIIDIKKMISEPYPITQAKGERSDLLKAFCVYSAAFNKAPDSDPSHADMEFLWTA
jgi:hypothetical protein